MQLQRISWDEMAKPGSCRHEAAWTLIVGARGLCDEAAFDALDASSFDFDWAASCGTTYDSGNEPLAAGDVHIFGTRAFAEGARTTLAYWLPPPAYCIWVGLTGGALLCRTERLAQLRLDAAIDGGRAPDQIILALTRRATMEGDHCAVLCELLAVETVAPEVRSLGQTHTLRFAAERLGRGVRASFANDQLRLAVRWARALSVGRGTT